jgi:lipopolysaccharide heptosyltransferase II
MSPPRPSDWTGVRRILAVRLDAMGDVLMTGPALRALASGGRHVTLLTSAAGAEVAAMLPGVADAIPYGAPWMKATAARWDPGLDGVMVERLRAGSFDGAVIFTVFSQSPLPAALLCHLAGIPLRAAHCRENPYQLLTDWLPEEEPELQRHEVERQLALVRRLGFDVGDDRLSVNIPAAARLRALAALHNAGVDLDRPWLILHPGASAPSRRYPPLAYAAAARRLTVEDGWQVVVAGSGADREVVDEIRAAMNAPSLSLSGALEVSDLAAAIDRARLFIGNNSGPAHLAAAVGTPSVVLYALTNPQHTPWRIPARILSHDVPCRNCFKSMCPMGHHACLRAIGPEEVVAAVRGLSAETAPRAPAFARA